MRATRRPVQSMVAVAMIVLIMCQWAKVSLADSKSQAVAHDSSTGPASGEKEAEDRLGKDWYGPFKGLSADQLWKQKPKMYRYEEYPPKTEEGIRMWQWWHAINEADPGFQHKTPIEFYGIVVDQSNSPVTEATVELHWTSDEGTKGKELRSNTDGRFNVAGIEGKRLSVLAYREGYRQMKQAYQSFEYASFSEYNFHLPNPTNPVVFRLWKYTHPEPMHKRHVSGTLSVDGKVTWIDIGMGRISESGDVGFSVMRSDIPGNLMPAYTVTIQATVGGGIAMSKGEELLFEAPIEGYQPSVTIEQKPADSRYPPNGDPTYNRTQRLNFYLKTADGKYAAIHAEVAQHNRPTAGLSMTIYFNPSGSRNLEFSDEKMIDPRIQPERGEPVKSRMEKEKKDKGKP